MAISDDSKQAYKEKGNCSITTGGDRRRRSMGLLKNCTSALIAE